MVTLDLTPFSIRAPTYQVIEHLPDGSYIQVKPAPLNTLRGFIHELPDAVVAGGVMETGLFAQIVLPDHRQFWIQPASTVMDDAPPGLHALYAGGEATDFSARCTTQTTNSVPTGTTFADRGGTQRWQALVAVDAEFQFYRQTGSSALTQQMVNIIFNIVNVQYEREVDIRHVLGTIIVRTFQNYNPDHPTDNMRVQFGNWWNANHQNIPRDLAVQLDGDGAGGQADPNADICNTSTAYCGCGMDWPNLSYRTDTVAHEIGHCWSACHCPCDTPPYTMNWIITYANRFEGSPASTPASDGGCGLNASSIAQIVNHRNSRECLDIVEAASAIPNDSCFNATTVPCGIDEIPFTCTFGFTNRGATTDGPLTGCRAGHNDIWYRYIAPCDGTLTVSTCFNSFDTLLFAYNSTACPPTQASQVGCDDDTACESSSTASRVSFATTRGTSYLIRISGYSGNVGTGILKFENAICARPVNDSCVAATSVGQGVDIPFSTVGATTGFGLDVRPDVPPHDSYLDSNCVGAVGDDRQIAKDIWFRYIAPCSGTTRFSTCGSSFDTKIAIYTPCPTDDNQALGCNDDSCGLQSSIDVFLTAGSGYLVRVGGYHGAVGTGTLRIDSFQCPPPANDNCSSTWWALTEAFAAGGTTHPASVDGSATLGNSNAPDVWYIYTPSCTGYATIDTCGSICDTVVSIHTGCPGTIANQIAIDDDACGNLDSRLTFNCVANQQYIVRVAAYSLATSDAFFIRAACTPGPPVNNACANATDVSSCANQNSYTLISATNDGSATCGLSASNPDVWFTFTAPYSGRLIAATCGSNDFPQADQGIDTVLSLHSGCPGTTANQIACSDDTSDPDCYQVGTNRYDSYLAYNIAAGETVKFRVSKYNTSALGRFNFYVRLIPSNAECSGAITIEDGSTTTYCTENAGTEFPNFPNQRADLWYRYTAPCDGDVLVSLCGSYQNAAWTVWQDSGACPPTFYEDSEYPSNHPNCAGFVSRSTFRGRAGESYFIEVGGSNTGPGIMYVSCTPNTGACCYGSLCRVTTNEFCVQGGGAFIGVGEPCKFPGNPVTCCDANINDNSGVSVQDIFDFLSIYFASAPGADFNNSGAISVQDIFDFLTAYFAGCA